MKSRKTVVGLLALLAVVAVGHYLIVPAASAEEAARPRPAPMAPEKLKAAWEAEAKCVAESLKITGDDVAKVVAAYASSRQGLADKVRSLPRTKEAFKQRREIADKALADLKEALTKAVGAEKAGKFVDVLKPSDTSSFMLDRMVSGLIAFELPKDKLNKAILCVLEYNKNSSKLMDEARKAGSFEGVRDKANELREALNKELAKLLSEEQMATWKKAYSRPLGGARRQP